MQTIQIRIPDDILKKIDDIIEKGLFRSRSHLLREALTKYISELNYIGTMPYIIGPFTPKEIELLKTEPLKSLVIPDSELKKITSTLKDFKV
jgi:hypothetical protein